MRTAGRLIFVPRNSKKQDGLQTEIISALGFIGHLTRCKLENARHALDRLPRCKFFADEKREDEVVGGKSRLAHEVANAFTATQSARPVNQFSHGARLSVCSERRKFAGT
jgi:hypothetical protein